jgi:hypothetical protein
VSNHGPAGIVYLGVPLDLLFFGTHGKKDVPLRYTAVVPALDSGKEFGFYIFNDCDVGVSAIWQQGAVAQMVGETRQRNVEIKRTYRSPVDQIMMFFPTTVRWTNEQVCEQ